MKRKAFMFIMAVVAAAGISASAQSACANQCPNQATCSKQNVSGPSDKMGRPHRFTDFAFEGILLDINQQQRMDSLNAAVKAQCGQACPRNSKSENCASGKPCKGEKACADSVCVAPCKGNRDCRKGMPRQLRADYVAKVKEILTPEQYTTFLENIVLMPAPNGPRQGVCPDKARGMKHSHDGAHRHHHGEKAKAHAAKAQQGAKAKSGK